MMVTMMTMTTMVMRKLMLMMIKMINWDASLIDLLQFFSDHECCQLIKDQ